MNDSAPNPDAEFFAKAERAMRDLFEKAKAAHELHFAMALMPEMRGMQDGGWNTAEEAKNAFEQFSQLLELVDKREVARLRVLLAFYQHTAECSGFYEVPKKMLLTIDGKGNNHLPFQKLVKKNRRTGKAIAPNANAIMKDMMGYAFELGLNELSEVFRDAFDSDIRNAIAHADYTLVKEGMRLRMRNGGPVRVVSWDEFNLLIPRGIGFFRVISQICDECVQSYDPPKVINSHLNAHEPLSDFTIAFDPEKGTFGITTGARL